jgi:hypothetical protein
MFFTADQLVAHAIGDFVIQSDWMASNKTKASLSCLVHAFTYTIPFMFLTQSVPALSVIGVTHFFIDRFRLAKYFIWAKNWIGLPIDGDWSVVNRPWSDCTATGFEPNKPAWMSVWLLIIVDNIMHVSINAAALHWIK